MKIKKLVSLQKCTGCEVFHLLDGLQPKIVKAVTS